MGTNGRGIAHVNGFASLPNTEIGYICDVDDRAVRKGIEAAKQHQDKTPKGVTDFRHILDDPNVDALTIATPNHWHAPATIMACKAGKHVYVEKPGSHNPYEAELMVNAAHEHDRVVQLGTQRRSWPWVVEAMERLHSGEIGRITFARTWYANSRGSIGHGQKAPVPDWLDYKLWQGAAPERPYKDNLIHYNWHWHWHWGNGELGNNGIHALDLARWGLQVDYPKQVTCGGGRYHYDDDQETPDVYITSFDFGNAGASWESQSCHPRGLEGSGFGVAFYGRDGALVISGNRYTVYDGDGNEVDRVDGSWDDAVHMQNFLDGIRQGKRPNAEIETGQKSTMLCHLGNIAYRTGHTLQIDPADGHIVDDEKAAGYWQREYRPDWKPTV